MPAHIATGVTKNLPQVVAVSDGWHSLGLSLEDFTANVAVVHEALALRTGPERDFDIIPSFHLRLAKDHETGYQEALASSGALPWGDNPGHPVNLFGSSQDIAARLSAYRDAGATACIISFLAPSLDDFDEQIAKFAAEVMPQVGK
jgi:alkanesulfonate monooxygenase SsuD/methylene tetrahydromethanopterin reductase-like flavin-dependent oxidoreductase (luciferase family)